MPLRQSSPLIPGRPVLLDAAEGSFNTERSSTEFDFCPIFGVDRSSGACIGFGSSSAAPSNAEAGGKRGEDCLSRVAASSAAPRRVRVAQGSRRSRPRKLGSPFLWLLSFGEAKESKPAGQRRTPALNKSRPAYPARKQAQIKACESSPTTPSSTSDE